MSQVRACIVTTSFIRSPMDGYARFVFEQAKSVLRTDADCSVVVVAPHAPGLASFEVVEGIEIHRFRYFFPVRFQCLAYQHEGLFATLRASPLALLQLPFFLISMLYRLFRTSAGCDIIHAQWLQTALIAIPVAKARKIPLCVSTRGADVNSSSIESSRLSRFILNNVDAVFTVSQEFYNRIADGQFKSDVYLLENGVDTSSFYPGKKTESRVRTGLQAPKSRILYVGGLIRRKRVDVLLRAFAQCQASLLPDCELCIAGSGPLEQSLRQLADSLDVADRVVFPGQINRDEVSIWINSADVVVLPSSSEGRPNIVLESFACAVPVIATNVNGTAELIDSGINGVLFNDGDDQELARLLVDCFQDRDKYKNMGRNAHRSLEYRGLSWEKHGEKLHSIYQDLID